MLPHNFEEKDQNMKKDLFQIKLIKEDSNEKEIAMEKIDTKIGAKSNWQEISRNSRNGHSVSKYLKGKKNIFIYRKIIFFLQSSIYVILKSIFYIDVFNKNHYICTIVGHHLNDRHAELLFYLQIAKNQEGFKD